MPTIHELLDDAQRQCDSLTKQITAYKSATSVNQQLAESLTTTAKALDRTLTEVRPLTEVGVRRNRIILYSGVGVTALLSLLNLIIQLIR